MPDSLPSPSPVPSPALASLVEQAKDYAAAARSENTARAYGADWRHFADWCARQGVADPSPDPRLIGLYITACASGAGTEKVSVSTIERRLAGIGAHFRRAGAPLDRQDRHIREVMAGIRNVHGAPARAKSPVLTEDMLAILATIPLDLRGLRDRAILLLGFAGGLRRSEIVGLDCGRDQTRDSRGWVEIVAGAEGPKGLLLTLRGKNGWREVEAGAGSSEATCPVRTVQTWMRFGKIAHGPLFRPIPKGGEAVSADRLSDRHVARLVKASALAAGLRGDIAEGDRPALFAGHSLRAGLASSAEVDERHIQKQLGHASAEMTRRYQRRRDRFRVNLTKAAGL